MPKYTEDGGVIPAGMPTSTRDAKEHYKMFGIYRGMVVRAVYPDDKDNTRGDRMEYVVRVQGQDYKNAVDVTELGGIYDYKIRVRKEISESSDGAIKKSTLREKMNGEAIYVMFVEGNGNVPLIIGSDQHPRHSEYNKTTRSEGVHDISEFNGIEVSIDKNSNYQIESVGLKDNNGNITNPSAVGSKIKMFSNGDIELNTHGTNGTNDLRMKMNKEDKSFEFYAQENKIVYDEDGISIIDKNNNEFLMEAGGVTVNTVGDCSIFKADGDSVEMKAGNVIDIKTKTLNIQADDVNFDVKNMNVTAQTGVNLDSPTVAATAELTANSMVAALSVAAATMAATSVAATSMVVDGQELADYANHTHDYTDNAVPMTTGGPNP